jgi:hypothetical protein
MSKDRSPVLTDQDINEEMQEQRRWCDPNLDT